MKKRGYKIYLFRHGKTVYNTKGIFTGQSNSNLTLQGKNDAKKIARKLKNKKFSVAFQTSLSRSQDTLKYVLKYHPECKKIITDDRMTERSYGILEGTSHDNFIKKNGKKAYKSIHRGYEAKVKGGESFLDVEKRVKSFIIYLKKYIKRNKVNVAISGHGNSIRLFRKIMERSSRKKTVSWFIPYDKIFEYTIKA